jgi:hypothetical protein
MKQEAGMDHSFAEEGFEADPMDLVEAVVGADNRFTAERGDDGDLTFSAQGMFCEVTGYFTFREELPAVLLTVSFDLRCPRSKLVEASRLTALINENLWLGHFDVWSADGAIVFRHAVPMIGRSELAAGEVQALLAAALDAADRFYPAYNFLFWAGKTPEEAVEAALFETVGEA